MTWTWIEPRSGWQVNEERESIVSIAGWDTRGEGEGKAYEGKAVLPASAAPWMEQEPALLGPQPTL
jgi:hypothetical protein